MIRILHVVTSMERGGIENLLMNIYRKTDRSRVQFDFLLHAEKKADFEYEIESLGGKIYRMPPRSPLKLVKYFKALFAFFSSHPEYKIVHSHIDEQSAYILYAAKKCGVPVRIAHSHTSSNCGGVKGAVKQSLRRFINGVCTHRFACSRLAADYMFGAGRSDVKIINNAVDCARFSFSPDARRRVRDELGLSDDLVLCHVGSVNKIKNQSFLIDVLCALCKFQPNSQLLCVGGGEDIEMLKIKAERLKVGDRVHFTGSVSNAQSYLSAADAFVFPSLYEGLPLAVVEAQANGLSCVVSSAVSPLCDLTGNVKFLPLLDSAEKWSLAALEAANAARDESAPKKIAAAGFDCLNAAKSLSELYLKAYSEVAE